MVATALRSASPTDVRRAPSAVATARPQARSFPPGQPAVCSKLIAEIKFAKAAQTTALGSSERATPPETGGGDFRRFEAVRGRQMLKQVLAAGRQAEAQSEVAANSDGEPNVVELLCRSANLVVAHRACAGRYRAEN